MTSAFSRALCAHIANATLDRRPRHHATLLVVLIVAGVIVILAKS